MEQIFRIKHDRYHKVSSAELMGMLEDSDDGETEWQEVEEITKK
jgi:hypothetical protein